MTKSADAFRTISEVADWLGVQTHVLRFWESKFTQVKPVKRAGGRRYYRPIDMQLLGGIRTLLHDEGMTIKGAQKLLREKGIAHVAAKSHPLEGSMTPAAPAPSVKPTPAPLAAEPPAPLPKVVPLKKVRPAPPTEPPAQAGFDFGLSAPEPEAAPQQDSAAEMAQDDAPAETTPAAQDTPAAKAPTTPISAPVLPAFLQRNDPVTPPPAAQPSATETPAPEAPASEAPVAQNVETQETSQQAEQAPQGETPKPAPNMLDMPPEDSSFPANPSLLTQAYSAKRLADRTTAATLLQNLTALRDRMSTGRRG